MSETTPHHPPHSHHPALHSAPHHDAPGGHRPEHAPEHIEVYVQAQGRPSMVLVRVAHDGSVRDLIIAAANAGLAVVVPGDDALLVSVEDADEPLHVDVRLAAAGVRHRGRVHLHRTRKVAVTVHFNGRQLAREFPPAATIERVHEWATGRKGFGLDPLDAAEHALQVTGTANRPAEDAHLGTLLAAPSHAVAFDLVPKQRVEG